MASYSTYAAPELKKAPIPIVRFNLNDDNYGTFAFDHLSGDGTSVSEEGHLKSLPGDLEGPVSVMSGAYSFLGDDGVTYKVTWTADGKRLNFTLLYVTIEVSQPMLSDFDRITSTNLINTKF